MDTKNTHSVRVGFWQNGFFVDFYFWAAGFFRGFCRRIFSPHFCGKKCPEKSSRKIPGKILQNLYNKNPRHISAEGPGQILREHVLLEAFLVFFFGQLRLWLWCEPFRCARRISQIRQEKPININIFGGTVSGSRTNRNRPWDKWDPSRDKMGRVPGTNRPFSV